WVPFVPLAGIGVCGLMMVSLPPDTWIRLAVWFFLGLIVYALYSSKHAKKPQFQIN
ncbi:MAG TPA: hypothetical protein DCL54_10685, partial [Alphaproteobacteria bacterium]|nr:hypothetical protein [Alphaproteobacteria bacterium]